MASRQTSKHFSISIPRVVLQRSADAKRKKYFAYEIQIVPLSERSDESRWSILRRYSDFHRLHKYLQKDNVAIKLLDFPPKKSFGNMVSGCPRRIGSPNYFRFRCRTPISSSCAASGCRFTCSPFCHSYPKSGSAPRAPNSSTHFHFSDKIIKCSARHAHA